MKIFKFFVILILIKVGRLSQPYFVLEICFENEVFEFEMNPYVQNLIIFISVKFEHFTNSAFKFFFQNLTTFFPKYITKIRSSFPDFISCNFMKTFLQFYSSSAYFILLTRKMRSFCVSCYIIG